MNRTTFSTTSIECLNGHVCVDLYSKQVICSKIGYRTRGITCSQTELPKPEEHFPPTHNIATDGDGPWCP